MLERIKIFLAKAGKVGMEVWKSRNQISLWFGDIFVHPTFSVIIVLITGVLWATGVITLFVFSAVIIAFIISFAGVARTPKIKNLPIKWRRLVLLAIAFVFGLGYYMFGSWALNEYRQRQEMSKLENKGVQPEEPQAVPNALPGKRDSNKETKVEIKQERRGDKRPYFALFARPEIKKALKYKVEFRTRNIGEHAAINLSYRSVLVDQLFESQPVLVNGSQGNDSPAGNIAMFSHSILVPRDYMVPEYWVLAIKYYDQEVLSQEPFTQIWCFSIARWSDIEQGTPPPEIEDASISQRDNILNHLKQELKEYLGDRLDNVGKTK